MKLLKYFCLLIFMSGCQINSDNGFSGLSSGHSLTIEKIGDGIVFPYEGTRKLNQSSVPVIATEYYGPYKFDKYEGVDNFATNGAYYLADIQLNKDKTVKVIFIKKTRDMLWLSGDYKLTTKGIKR